MIPLPRGLLIPGADHLAPDEILFRFADGGVFQFPEFVAWLGQGPVPQPAPAANPAAPAATEAVTAPEALPVEAPATVTEEPVVAAPPPPQDPDPALPPAPQSQAELDLMAQYAGLFDEFDGSQALDELLASDWAAQNGWQSAGGSPIA